MGLEVQRVAEQGMVTLAGRAEQQIPPEFLSHNEPDEPFACFKLNNGLSDTF